MASVLVGHMSFVNIAPVDISAQRCCPPLNKVGAPCLLSGAGDAGAFRAAHQCWRLV